MIPEDLIYDKSMLDQIMAWFCMATILNENEMWETIGFGDYTDLLWWMWFKQLVLPIDH